MKILQYDNHKDGRVESREQGGWSLPPIYQPPPAWISPIWTPGQPAEPGLQGLGEG